MIRLEAGGYEASIDPVGAALLSLRLDGRDLVMAGRGRPPAPRFTGAVLVPWPNRIADGRYTYRGVEHQLPVTEPERGCALHGLALWSTWSVRHLGTDRVVLAHEINPQPGYPFALCIEAAYDLDARTGLTVTVRADNLGETVAPYGVSIHPYLRPDDGPVDDWTLRLDASEVLDVDPDRLLPTGLRAVAGTRFDFRGGRAVGSTEIDHAFTGFADAAGPLTAVVTGVGGDVVRMSWPPPLRWVQVHTTDRPGHPEHRRGLALEPMTCPPNAFTTGTDVIDLHPGDVHTAFWRIEGH